MRTEDCTVLTAASPNVQRMSLVSTLLYYLSIYVRSYLRAIYLSYPELVVTNYLIQIAARLPSFPSLPRPRCAR